MWSLQLLCYSPTLRLWKHCAGHTQTHSFEVALIADSICSALYSSRNKCSQLLFLGDFSKKITFATKPLNGALRLWKHCAGHTQTHSFEVALIADSICSALYSSRNKCSQLLFLSDFSKKITFATKPLNGEFQRWHCTCNFRTYSLRGAAAQFFTMSGHAMSTGSDAHTSWRPTPTNKKHKRK